MRADRLISLLMLLQARGRMTAKTLAAELEVSERTIYRDVEALSASGVPICAEAGPQGGLALLDSYRTTLTGLTESEVRALFMLSTPAPLAARIHDDVVHVIRQPQVRARFAAQGLDVHGTSSQDFAAYLKAEVAKWSQVIQVAGLNTN